jgi:Caudovirus prohead serine protease
MQTNRIFTREAADHTVFTRDVALTPQSWKAEQRTFSVVVSTGADVERRDHKGVYIERPSIDQNWRALIGAPVLNAHQRSDIKNILRGVTDISVVGKEVRATIRMSKSPEGEAAVQAALEGHLRGISFGYRIDSTKESSENGKRIVTITKLTPIELSLVPIPADPGSVIRGSNQMDPQTAQQTDPPPLTDRAAINVEIRTIARTLGLPQTFVDTQIDQGATIDAVRAAAIASLANRSANITYATAPISGHDSNDPAWRSRAIGGAIAARMIGGAPAEESREFVGLSLVEMCRDLLRQRGLPTHGSAGVIVERALTSSDFPALMSDAANRSMRLRYEAVPSALKRVAKQITAPDFRTIHKIQLSSAPTLKPVNQANTNGAVSLTPKRRWRWQPSAAS